MPSLIGKALAVRNQGPPVPMAPSSRYGFSGLMSGTAADSEAYMRAHGTVGTVWQIVHLLSSNVAKPVWKLYRTAPQDGRVRYTTNDQGSDQRVEVIQHQARNVLYQPASFLSRGVELAAFSRFTLFEASQMYMELAGESFWVVSRDPRSSVPLGLWPVRPDRMEPVPDPEVWLKGWIYTAPDGREKVPLFPDEVVQVKYPNPLDPYRGLGPVQSVLVDIDASRYSREWNKNFFLNSAEPGGVIQVDHELQEGEFDELVERWREGHRGVARAHRVAVLEGGQTWVPNMHSQKDMDFTGLLNVGRDLIREAFGIHKIMLGNSDDVNRANAQTGEEVFANWSIAPRLDRWRDALNYQFLPLFGSAGEGVEFDYIYPLPQNREQDNAELLAKANAAQLLTAAGFDPHDVLQVVGLPDMDTAAQDVGEAPGVGAPPDATPGQAPESDGNLATNRLPWAPFTLGDRRFSQVNGHPLVEVR